MLSDPDKRAQYDRFGDRRRAGRRGRRGLRHHLRGPLRGLLRRRRARPPHARAPRRGPPLRPRDHARGGRGGARDEAPDPAARDLRGLPGRGASSRAPSPRPAHLPRPGPGAAQQGFLTVACPAPRAAARGRSTGTRARRAAARAGSARERLLKVTIPAGRGGRQAAPPHRRGRGRAPGGPAGDLYVVLHVRPHEIFARQGADLLCELPLTFPQAALGDEVEVPVLKGGPS